MAKLLLEENDILAEDVTGDDVEGTVEAAKIIIDQLPKDKDKNKWTNTVTKIIDELPKETYVAVADILNSTGGGAKVDDQTKQVVANEVDADMETANGWNTVADILKYVDLAALSKEDPKKAKSILIAVLTIIAVVEPTIIGEVITTVVTMLPNNVLAKILQVLGYVNPIHWLRQGVLKLADKNDAKDTLQERLIEFDPNEWNEEDIEFWHTIDWSARHYDEFEKTDDILKNQTVVRIGDGEGPNEKIVDMVKVFRPNPIYPPYYRAIENPFPGSVGPMYDGRTYGKVHIHDRYETPETYDMLSM